MKQNEPAQTLEQLSYSLADNMKDVLRRKYYAKKGQISFSPNHNIYETKFDGKYLVMDVLPLPLEVMYKKIYEEDDIFTILSHIILSPNLRADEWKKYVNLSVIHNIFEELEYYMEYAL